MVKGERLRVLQELGSGHRHQLLGDVAEAARHESLESRLPGVEDAQHTLAGEFHLPVGPGRGTRQLLVQRANGHWHLPQELVPGLVDPAACPERIGQPGLVDLLGELDVDAALAGRVSLVEWGVPHDRGHVDVLLSPRFVHPRERDVVGIAAEQLAHPIRGRLQHRRNDGHGPEEHGGHVVGPDEPLLPGRRVVLEQRLRERGHAGSVPAR